MCLISYNYNFTHYADFRSIFQSIPILLNHIIRIWIAKVIFGFIVDKTLSFFGTGNSGNIDKKKYESLTLSIRQTVLERSHHRCQKCSVKFRGSNGPFFEHINGSLKDNRPSNLRSLCDKCFEHVKKKESRKGFLGNMRNNLGQMFGN